MRLSYRALLGVCLWTAAAAAESKASTKRSFVREARSVVILREDERIFAEPRAGAPRRGSAVKDVRLPLFAMQRGSGCKSAWFQVGPLAWICGDEVRLSDKAPIEPDQSPVTHADGLPYRYFFVGENGSLGYRVLSSAEQGPPDHEFEPGFALATVRTARQPSGERYALTAQELWVPMRDLNPARPLLFEGRSFEPAQSTLVGWVVAESAAVYESPGGRRLPHETRTRFEELEIQESVNRRGQRWLRIGAAQWLRSADVRSRTPALPPASLRPDERWIDIDIANQILTAYLGNRAVFSTLVSTGKGPNPGPQATPKGVFRVWVKLLGSDMDNLEAQDAGRYYSIQRVPWVMYFKDGFGLHGTFWHRSFGHVQSHGCINLTPLDAQRLFGWTRPRLPAGWTAVLPTPYDQGTVISVR